MNDVDAIDLSLLRAARWHGHAARLEDKILTSLGSRPRPLPGLLRLTLEAAATPVLYAAAVIIVFASAGAQLLESSAPRSHDLMDLITGDSAPGAAEIYLAVREYEP